MRDLVNNISIAASVVPAVHSATVTGTVVDLRGYDSASVGIVTGAIVSDGDFTPKLQHGDESNLSDAADVAAADLQDSFPTILAASSSYHVGYRGSKRYVRVVLTNNGGTSIAASAAVLRGHAAQAPV